MDIRLDYLAENSSHFARELFNEELGAIIQVARQDTEFVLQQLSAAGLEKHTLVVGQPTEGDELIFRFESGRGPSIFAH